MTGKDKWTWRYLSIEFYSFWMLENRLEDWQHLRDLKDNKWSNILTIEVPKEEEKVAGLKEFREIMAANFSNLVKDIYLQIQEVEKIPSSIQRNTKNVIVKICKAKSPRNLKSN